MRTPKSVRSSARQVLARRLEWLARRGSGALAGSGASRHFHGLEALEPRALLDAVTVTASDPDASEAALDGGQFTFTRDATVGDLIVHFSLGGGTSTNGQDHQSIELQITIPNGQASTTLAVTPIQDNFVEGDETVVVTLSSNDAYTIGAPSEATVTIHDNDTNGVFLVVNNGDSGSGTLRDAITRANANPGLDEIHFNIFNSGNPVTITPLTQLPTITGPVVIDGYTQPGAAANTAAAFEPTNTTLMVSLDGRTTPTEPSNSGAWGLRIDGGGTTVRGLNIFGFNGAQVLSQFGDNNVIQGNFLGTNVTGTTDPGGGGSGVFMLNGSINNLIGGETPAARNLISGNGNSGVSIGNVNARDNTVRGNFIGTNAAGTAAIANSGGGMSLNSAVNITVIGNLISGNQGAGVQVFNAGTTGILIQGNRIGTNAAGSAALANSTIGVQLYSAASGAPSNVTIGGSAEGQGNTIAFNGGDGIAIEAFVAATPTGVSILGNSIHSNGGLGIDLANDGITANDDDDADAGINNLQNYPELTGAVAGSTHITGNFNGTPSTQFRIEFFSNDAADGSGHGEGRTFLTFVNATTDAQGNVALDALLAEPLSAGKFITATATDPAGNTSEFSNTLTVTVPEGPPTVAIEATDAFSSEIGPDLGTFTLTRTGSTTEPLTVHFTIEGSAGNGGDYQEIDIVQVIDAGQSSKTITVTPIGDNANFGNEPDEIVTLVIAQDDAYTVGSPSQASVTINDDPTITITASDPTGTEAGDDNIVFTITRNGPLEDSVPLTFTVTGSATEGVDYAAILPHAITIPNGLASINLNPIQGIDDNVIDPNETITLTLQPGTGFILGTSSATGTWTDNDAEISVPTITATTSDPNASENGTNPGSVTFTRDAFFDNDLTLHIATAGSASNGTDYNFVGQTLVIPAGQASATLDITPINDGLFEGDETVIALIVANPAYFVGQPNEVTVTIHDDEVPPLPIVTVTASDANASEPGSNIGAFTFARQGSLSGDLTVHFSLGAGTATNGDDHADIALTFVIPDGQQSATLAVTPIDDAFVESDETVVVTLADADTYTVGGADEATVTIQDNDQTSLPVITAAVGGGTGTETGPVAATAIVTRTGATGSDLVVRYTLTGSAGNGTDFVTLTGSVTIPAGQQSAAVAFTPIDDSAVEGLESVTLKITADDAYAVGGNNIAALGIVDNDGPNLTIQFDPALQLPGPIVPGNVINLTGTALNIGVGTLVGKVGVNIYLLPANQSFPGGNDTPIAFTTIKGASLKPAGAPIAWKAKATVPGNRREGSYHFVAVIDSQNVIPESNESDNTGSTANANLELRFGAVDGRAKPVKKSTINGVTYSISGPGGVHVIRGAGNAADSLVVTGGSTATSITGKVPKNTAAQVDDISITGDAKAINLKGFLLTGDVNVSGLLSALTVGDVAPERTLTIGGVDPAGKAAFSLTAEAVRDLAVNSSIPIKAIKAAVWDDTDIVHALITAPSIGTILSNGDFEANITTTNAQAKVGLKSLTAKGVLNTTLRSASGIGSVTGGRIVNSLILAGMHTNVIGLPSLSASFINQLATINSVKATGIKNNTDPSFVNSVIAAATVGGVTLKDVTIDNGNVPFGVAADLEIKSFSRTGGPSVKNLNIVGDSFTDNDFILRIV